MEMGTWLKNVRIEKGFEETDDGVVTRTEKVDVLIESGVIREIVSEAGETSGHRADFLLVDASCSAEAVARFPKDRVVMKNGLVTSGKL